MPIFRYLAVKIRNTDDNAMMYGIYEPMTVICFRVPWNKRSAINTRVKQA
jgi:hypothetical protein